MITSGVGLDFRRAEQLRQSGLDTVQISLQADEAALADDIAGASVHERKLSAALAVVAAGFPLGLNVVLHRHNIDRLPAILQLAESLGASRIELANIQFYGRFAIEQRSFQPASRWPWLNKSLPAKMRCVGCK